MTPTLNFLPTYKHQGSSDEMLQDVLPSLKILSRQIVPKLKAPSKKLSDSIQHRYCMDTIFPETAFCCIEVWCMDPVFPQTAFSFSVNGLAPPGRLKRQKNGSGELHPLYSTSNKPLKGTGCVLIFILCKR